MRFLPDRIGLKLNLFLLILVATLGVATAGLVAFGFSRSQERARAESERGIERFAQQTLSAQAAVVAEQGNAELAIAGRVTEMLARTYLDAPATGATGAWTPAAMTQGPAGETYDPRPGRASDLWLQAGIPLSAAEEEFRRSAVLDAVFPGAMRESPQAIAVYFIGANGAVRYYPPIDLHAQLPPDGDIHEVAVGYRETAPEENPNRRTIWLPPYDDPAGRGLMVSAMTPIWDGTQFLGVTGIDISLDRLIGLINDVKPTENGYAFMLGGDGELIPTSSVDELGATLGGPEGAGLSATLGRMRAGEIGVDRLMLDGRDVFIAYAPYPEIGGSLALVAPVEDIRQQANTADVASAIDREGQRTVMFTIIVLGCLLVAALAVGAVVNSRLLMQPIGALVQGTRRVAAGDLQAAIPVRTSDELGLLAHSFNDMTAELAAARERVEERNTELEAQVAERLRVEEELRRSEGLYRNLTRNLPDGAVLLFDHDLRYTIADGAVLATIGMSSEQLVGRTVDELFEPPLSTTLAANYRKALAGASAQFEVEVEDTWFLVSVSPLRDEAGRVFAGQALALNVTERKRAEEQLREKEGQYRSIFAASSEALFITDMDDRIIDANPAAGAMFGYSLEEMRALEPFAIIEPQAPGATEHYLRTLREGRPYRARSVGVRKDGSRFPVDVLGTPIMYQGSPHILGVMRDITEQVESERVLEQRVEERTRELASLLEVARGLTAQLDVDGVVRVILRNLNMLLDSTGSAVVTIEDGIATHRASDTPGIEAALGGARINYRIDDRMDTFGPIWERMQRGEAVRIDDVRGEGELAAAYRGFAGPALESALASVRSWIGVPMMRGGRVSGALFVSRDEPGFFTERHVELARAIANQASVAIDNAGLYEQTRAQADQLATLLGVSQNITATIELEPLLQLILDQVGPLVGADRTAFMILEDGDLVMRAVGIAPGTPNQEAYVTLLGARYRAEGTPYMRTLRSRQPIIIDDARGASADAAAYRSFVGEDVLEHELLGMRAWMGIPLALQDRVVGMLALSNSQPAYFNETHARLASAIANQAAIAVENAFLYERTRRQTQELTALLEISHSIASTLDRGRLVSVVLDQLHGIIDYYGCTVFEREDDALVVIERDGTSGARIAVIDSPLWRTILSREPVLVDDIHDPDDPTARDFRAAAGPLLETALANGHAWMAMPIALPDRVVGVLTLSHAEPRYFNRDVARTVRAVADQFAVALENARLYEESSRRARELSALLAVSHAVASTLDLEQIVGVVLDQLRIVVEYTGSSIIIERPDSTAEMIETRVRDERQRGAGMRFPLDPQHPIWREIRQLRAVVIDDVRADSEYAVAYRASVGDQLDGMFSHVRSWIAVPLAVGDKAIGFISCSRDEPGYFTDRHVQLARAVADQAAVAMENSRLYSEAQRRAREMEALFRADRELFRSLSLSSVFQALVDVIVDVLAADKALVFTIDQERRRMDLEAHRNLLGATISAFRQSLMQAAREGVFPQLTAPTILDYHVLASADPVMRSVIETEGVQASIDVPILAGDRLLGVFLVGYVTPHQFSDDEQRLLMSLADRAAVAVQNAALYERAQQAASLEERQRLARELHDSVSQALYGIALGARTARTQLDRDPAKAADPMDYVLQLAEAGLTEMRALIFELRPESLETEGLVAALEKQVAATRARYGLTVDAEFCAEPEIAIDLKEAAYRITQEALHNVVKHARASHVHVRMQKDAKELLLTITDDGAGFDTGGSFPGHIGLRSMRERMARAGGTLDIRSAPGKGTSVAAHIPLGDA